MKIEKGVSHNLFCVLHYKQRLSGTLTIVLTVPKTKQREYNMNTQKDFIYRVNNKTFRNQKDQQEYLEGLLERLLREGSNYDNDDV